MPKVSESRGPRPETLTVQRRNRASRVEEEGLEMSFRCRRCEEKSLRCFVKTTTSRCAGCISVSAKCSLFVSEEEWKSVQRAREEEELAVARLKAELASREVALLEVKKRERSYAHRDLAILAVQDRAQEQSGEGAASSADPLAAEPSLPGPSANLSYLQANSFDFLSLVDPLLDPNFSSFLNSSLGLNFAALDTVNL